MEEHSIVGDLPTSAFVQNSYLFKSLDADGCKMLIDNAYLGSFAEDEVIIREGDDGDAFYLIKSGSVEISVEKDSKKVVLSSLKRGAFFGEVSVLTENSRTATVTAEEDCELVVFNRKNIQGVLQKYPRVKAILHAILIARAQNTIQNM